MDIIELAPPRIVTVARAAYARPGTSVFWFGESAQPAPPGAAAALRSALDRGDALYPDVRGVLALRHTQAPDRLRAGLRAR